MTNITHEKIPTSEKNEEVERTIDKEVDRELSRDLEEGETESLNPIQSDYDRVPKMKPFNVNDDPCIKKLKIIEKCAFVVFCVVSIIALIDLFTGYNFYKEYLFKEEVSLKEPHTYHSENSSVPNPEITTDLSSKNERSFNCEDYPYGCCEVYDSCSVENDSFISNSIFIDPRVIHKEDPHGLNCPRFLDMIQKYSVDSLYGKEACKYSEFGCCDLNYICDIRSHYKYRSNSDEEVIDQYLLNIRRGIIRESTHIIKEDSNGRNCPGPQDIIDKYETEYLNQKDLNHKDSVYEQLLIIWGIAMIVLCICFCILDSNPKKSRW